MKKSALMAVIAILLAALVACGSSEPKEEITADGLLNSLKEKISTVGTIVVFDEESDPNGNLGRPGNYIGKADFEDTRVESFGETLSGGTIEVFSSKSDCNDRYKYLSNFLDADMGALGLNQYMYKYDFVIFRVSFDLTPEQASEYEAAMNEIMGETAKTPE